MGFNRSGVSRACERLGEIVGVSGFRYYVVCCVVFATTTKEDFTFDVPLPLPHAHGKPVQVTVDRGGMLIVRV